MDRNGRLFLLSDRSRNFSDWTYWLLKVFPSLLHTFINRLGFGKYSCKRISSFVLFIAAFHVPAHYSHSDNVENEVVYGCVSDPFLTRMQIKLKRRDRPGKNVDWIGHAPIGVPCLFMLYYSEASQLRPLTPIKSAKKNFFREIFLHT